MASNIARGTMPPPSNAPLPPTNQLWERSARTIAKTALVTHPAAVSNIVQVQGFQTWQQDDIYRIDWSIFYDSAAGPVNDMQLWLGALPYLVLPLPAVANLVIYGSVFIAPDNMDITIKSIAGSGSANYSATLA